MAILSESTIVKENKEVTIYKLLNDSSTKDTSSTAVDVLDASALTLLVETGTGVSAGVVTLEAARTSDYSGTWASLTTVTTNAASTTFMATVDDGDTIGSGVPYVRANISTGITGGTIDVYLIVTR
ncbi:MAG: hypothetical protein BWY21_01969 [Parcubacteria group bacterium ADurb.Bin216]|jgi:hypothetical protein|nr:MAG: hypothetical protein BWY21_01969 [Parcubacteria group bacterium ADurb.Bin216]